MPAADPPLAETLPLQFLILNFEFNLENYLRPQFTIYGIH